MLIGWFWPVSCGIVVYGLAWFFGFARLEWTSVEYPYGSWGPENLVGISVAGMVPILGFLVRLIASLFFSFVVSVQTFGEELGWRGYMLTRLIDARIPVPIFWNGLIWGLWHVPYFLVLTSGRNRPEHRVVSLFFFVTSTIATGYLISYLRLRSGSIWPSVLAHASANSVFTLAFSGFTVANRAWKGELYLLSVAIPVALLMLSRRPWVVHYRPGDPGA